MKFKKLETDFCIPPLLVTHRVFVALEYMLRRKGLLDYKWDDQLKERQIIRSTTPKEISESVSYDDLKSCYNLGTGSINELKQEMLRLGVQVNWDPAPPRKIKVSTILKMASSLTRNLGKLSDAQRKSIFEQLTENYCFWCGCDCSERACHCMNDE